MLIRIFNQNISITNLVEKKLIQNELYENYINKIEVK